MKLLIGSAVNFPSVIYLRMVRSSVNAKDAFDHPVHPVRVHLLLHEDATFHSQQLPLMSAARNVDGTGVTIDLHTIAELLLLFLYQSITTLLCNEESYWHLTESLDLQQGQEVRNVDICILNLLEVHAPA
jgi:hypothetical protein